jgi:hypothetical protein
MRREVEQQGRREVAGDVADRTQRIEGRVLAVAYRSQACAAARSSRIAGSLISGARR